MEATYIYPHEDPKLGINGGISPSRVEMYLEEKKDIEAVLITSPTYDGIVSDIARIADIAHNHGVPLIVDEAHGAHFCFSDYFPVSAAQLGADVVINSVHKTLPLSDPDGSDPSVQQPGKQGKTEAFSWNLPEQQSVLYSDEQH